MLFHKDGTQLTGPPVPDSYYPTYWSPVFTLNGQTHSCTTEPWWNGANNNQVELEGKISGIFNNDAVITTDKVVYHKDENINYKGINGKIIQGLTELRTKPLASPEEIIFIDEITEDVVFFIGGHVNEIDGCNHYQLRIEAEMTEQFIRRIGGTGNPPVLPKGNLIGIETQEKAQQALERIDNAIVSKDTIRAHLGALQNRLENTVTNLSIQAENLQASESRISDTDVATEMTAFVRNQILTESATAMLSQANSFPHMLMNLLQG